MTRSRASLLLTVTLLLPTLAFAQPTKLDKTDSVQLELGNDLYMAGNVVDITRNLPGDLNAAGSKVYVRGTVNGDVQAAGSDVTIDSTVRDDVRVAAGNVTVNGTIDGDLIVFAGTVYIARGATIVGNIVAYGGEITIDGAVRGNVRIGGENIRINGSIGGVTDIDAQRVFIGGSVGSGGTIAASQIGIASNAQVRGNVRYWQEAGSVDFGISNASGSLMYDESLMPAGYTTKEEAAGIATAFLGAFAIYGIFFAALTILLFQLATRTMFIDAAKRMNADPWWSLIAGLMYFLFVPFIVIILMLTIIGIPLGLALLALYTITLIFCKVIAAMVLARWAELRTTKKNKKWHPAAAYFAALGIYIIFALLEFIPIIGWLTILAAVLFAYGSFMLVKADRYKKVR